MRTIILSLSALAVLATVATAETPPCNPTVSAGQPKWTRCVPDELHAPTKPKPVSGMGLTIRK